MEDKNFKKSIFLIALITIVLISIITVSNLGLTGRAVENFPLNIEIEIPPQYQTATPGQEIYFTTKILNLASQERMDITLKYELLTQGNSIISTKSKTVAIETQASFVGDLTIPDDLEEGQYVLAVKVIQNNNEIVSSHKDITIKKQKTFVDNILEHKLLFGLGLIPLILIIILIIKRNSIKRYLEKRKIKGKIKGIIKNKVETQKITSEELKKSKIISNNQSQKSVEEKEDTFF